MSDPLDGGVCEGELQEEEGDQEHDEEDSRRPSFSHDGRVDSCSELVSGSHRGLGIYRGSSFVT